MAHLYGLEDMFADMFADDDDDPFNRQVLPKIRNHIEFADRGLEFYTWGKPAAEHESDGHQRAVALARLSPTAQVLDIACGDGIIGKIVADSRSQSFDNIFFADAADDMLDRVRRDLVKITGANRHASHVARCDLRDSGAMNALSKQFSRSTKFRSRNGFDYVFATNIIHHITDETQAKAINQLFSFVKPGGFLIIDWLVRQKGDKSLLSAPMVRTCHPTGQDVTARLRPIAAAHCVGPEQLRHLSGSFAALVERVGAGDLVRMEERHSRSDDIGVKWENLTRLYDAALRASTAATAEDRYDEAVKQALYSKVYQLEAAHKDKYTTLLSFGYNAVFKKA